MGAGGESLQPPILDYSAIGGRSLRVGLVNLRKRTNHSGMKRHLRRISDGLMFSLSLRPSRNWGHAVLANLRYRLAVVPRKRVCATCLDSSGASELVPSLTPHHYSSLRLFCSRRAILLIILNLYQPSR